MKRIAIFASGSGSNAENIATHFQQNEHARITLFLTNNPKAKVLERAKRLQIPAVVFNRHELLEEMHLLRILKDQKIELIVLAGFLLKIPTYLIKAYPNRIINIHPALLPKYGGKGMYGKHVHEAVIKAKENNSGITIHYVNENYDEGTILFQASCKVDKQDDADSLAQKIHQLEYQHFPEVIQSVVENG